MTLQPGECHGQFVVKPGLVSNIFQGNEKIMYTFW